MNEINRERFEAWVEHLRPGRVWDYIDSSNCVICSFLKETTNCKRPVVIPDSWRWDALDRQSNPLPDWLRIVLGKCRDVHNKFRYITTEDLQKHLCFKPATEQPQNKPQEAQP